MNNEDSLFGVLGAGSMELCWLFVMMHGSAQPANRKQVSGLVGCKIVFAFHIAFIL